jgi:hypothetical protein
MPKFNKSKGFKQTGFSYPGMSPLKGKRKTREKLAASEKLADANATMDEFGEMKMESTDLMSDKGFSITGGGAPSPMKSGEGFKPPSGGGFLDLFGKTGGGGKKATISKGSPKATPDIKGPSSGNPEVKVDAPATESGGGSGIGGSIASAAVTAAISSGISAIASSKKQKPSRRGPDVSGFSQLKFGRK